MSNVSYLFQNGQFLILACFGSHFSDHSNGKSQINIRLLHLGYWSNELIRRILCKAIFFLIFGLMAGEGGTK